MKKSNKTITVSYLGHKIRKWNLSESDTVHVDCQVYIDLWNNWLP